MKKVKSLVALALAVMLALSLAGCGEVEKAEKAVVGMLESVKACDFEKVAEYLGNDDYEAENISSLYMLEGAFSSVEYEILSSELNEDGSVTVKTKISTIDMKAVTKDFVADFMQYALVQAFSGNNMSDEEIQVEMERIFKESLEEGKDARVSTEIDIVVSENADGKWIIDGTDELSAAISGDVVNALNEASAAFNS